MIAALRRAPQLALGIALCGCAVVAALVSLVWTPHDPAAIDLARALAPPSWTHPLGTDPLGRDVLSMVLAGARASLGVALGAVLIGVGIGAPLGLLAGVRGGVVDGVVMRLNDVAFAFPALLLAILLTSVIGQNALNAAIAIGVFNIPVFARLVRGDARALMQRDFVLAARAGGMSRLAIARRHILPNLADQVLIQGATQVSVAVLAEAALSYVGIGVQPPTPSWGRMLSETQTFSFLAPHLAIAPGLAIFATVLGLSLLADGLREARDPRRAA
ncbi:MAG: ABC transporter permease [Hyphomonadaceae bacterium]|nr:ABC transporter permease [Hyphomonadaceae bacterium]